MPDESLLARARERVPAFLDDLAMLSGMECGTYDKSGVDAVGAMLRARLEGLGFAVEAHDGGALGDTLVARLRGDGRARLLLIGHLDTVYPRGWPAEHPFTIDGDRATGPGTADMKAGLLCGLYALDLLRAAGFSGFGEIAYVLNSDEEIGSPSSHEVIEAAAAGRDAALVLEAGRANGNIVSARKGIGRYTLSVSGRSAHAGVEPDKGRNAILELAHHVVALQGLNGTVPGATLNVGVVEGGTRTNVVPDSATARLEVRAADRAGLDAIMEAVGHSAARTFVDGTSAVLSGEVEHLPMEKTAASARLIAWCQESAAAAGFAVEDTATGGASDGNTTAGMGIPTLDGLGVVGGGAHSPGEYVVISSIAPRVAMLAGLIERICV